MQSTTSPAMTSIYSKIDTASYLHLITEKNVHNIYQLCTGTKEFQPEGSMSTKLVACLNDQQWQVSFRRYPGYKEFFARRRCKQHQNRIQPTVQEENPREKKSTQNNHRRCPEDVHTFNAIKNHIKGFRPTCGQWGPFKNILHSKSSQAKSYNLHNFMHWYRQ